MISTVYKLNHETRTKGPLTWCMPKRYIVTLLGFLAAFINSIQKANMSVVIVAMVGSTGLQSSLNSSYTSNECPVSEKDGQNLDYMGEGYNFNAIEQGHILGSYFYSYFITVILGGQLSQIFGAVRVISCSILVPSVLDLVLPTASSYGLYPLLTVRSLQGIFGGGLFPALNVMISRWSAKLERSRIFTIIFIGIPMGVLFQFSISGWICSSEYLGGSSTVFYVSGVGGLCWCCFWCCLVYEIPSAHPTISNEELANLSEIEVKPDAKNLEVPWRRILVSLPFWAPIFGITGTYFTFVTMLTELPAYLSKVLHFNVSSSGILSSLPYIANIIGGLISSHIADELRQSGKCSITTIRKIFNSLSGYIMGICLIAVTFCGCNSMLIIGLVTFGMLMDGCKYSGSSVVCVDMCPKLSGVLYGICNGIASLSGFVGPAMVGYLVADGDTITNWRKVFYATAGVRFVAATFFLVFASAEPQPWGGKNEPANEKESAIEKGKLETK